MKRTVTVLLVFLAASLPVFGQKVASVSIEGLKNVKEKAVRGQLKTRTGKQYSEDIVTGDIQNILGLGYFDNAEVTVDSSTWRITFKVMEKPFIKKIAVKGNKKFSQGRIKDEMLLKEKEYYDLSKMEESKTKIATLYGDKGYADMKLEVYPTVDEATNQMTVSFLITEGNRILIGDVILEGVNSFKPKKVRKLMKTRRSKVYKEETLQEDRREIEKFYKNNGYNNVKVSEPEIEYNAERTRMVVIVTVNEGPRYKIGTIGFAGNTVFGEQELRKPMAIKSGEIFNDERLQESRQSMLEMYSDRGYLHAQVEPQYDEDPQKGIMDITFTIAEDAIVYMGNVFIDGLVSTKEKVIRREITLKEGDVFSAAKVRRSLEKIYNLGFIDAVEPQIMPTEKPDVMDLGLNVTEGKPGMLSAGAGYSSVDQFVGTLQVQHINLFGRAQRLNLTWEFGARKQNYEISWTEPWFLDRPMSFGLSAFNTDRLRDYGSVTSAYHEARKGGSASFGPRLSDILSLQFTYSYEQVEIYDIDQTVLAAIQAEQANANILSNGITSSLSSQIVRDTRDNIFDASRGNRQSLSVQLAGGPLGGTENFVKPIVRTSWFFPTFWKFVFSLNGTAGLVQNFAPSDDVKSWERFYVGGADTVRGYAYRDEIGPDRGGKMMAVFNAEYKFPIVQERKRTILQGAFFADMGGSWLDPQDFRFTVGEGETDMKVGVGFGIRFTTPVFPLRLDWGYGLNHKPGEDLSQFYFTIGNMF